MKKYSNRELCHVWANQIESEGKGSNMFFEGSKIYSYGKHFCIANIVTTKGGEKVTLFTTRDYSKTTAKHKSYVNRAIHGMQFNVPFVRTEYDLEPTKKEHEANLAFLMQESKNLLFDATKAKGRSGQLLSQSQGYFHRSIEYAETFKLRKPKVLKAYFWPMPEGLQERIDRQHAKEETRLERERVARETREKNLRDIILPLWISGIQYYNDNGTDKSVDRLITGLYGSFLRVELDKVVTSHGAKVSLKSAKVLFDLIQSGKDVKGFDIDGYTVISMNGVLTIGCHKIEKDEIYRFAKTQNWI